jgi:hypothetical protein
MQMPHASAVTRLHTEGCFNLSFAHLFWIFNTSLSNISKGYV